MVKNPPSVQEMQVQSLGWKDHLEEGMASPLHAFLPGESHGQRSLWGYMGLQPPKNHKEFDMTEATEHADTREMD